jgi:hypothetical protein
LLSDELRCERKLGFFNDFWLDFLGMNWFNIIEKRDTPLF